MQIPDPKLIAHMQHRLKSFFSCGHGITVRVGVGTGSALQLLKQAIRSIAHSIRQSILPTHALSLRLIECDVFMDWAVVSSLGYRFGKFVGFVHKRGSAPFAQTFGND